ncbi:MAG: acyltransferase family protein [Burkholderiales bacterium]|nr:acyltransferase family protein [Burkholderiales bacterium]
MSALTNRMPLIDAFKAVASQLIVLHHLAFYGPMSDWTHTVAPGLVGWFSQDGRLAVQVFLVISGYLAVRALAPKGVFTGGNPWGLLRHRYLTIVVPYAVALMVAIVCAWLARQWMTHHSVPEAAQPLQFLWHVLLLNGVLDTDSLSAGVWYIAIDFQLFALMLALLWLGQRWAQPARAALPVHGTAAQRAWPTLVLVVGMGLASL